MVYSRKIKRSHYNTDQKHASIVCLPWKLIPLFYDEYTIHVQLSILRVIEYTVCFLVFNFSKCHPLLTRRIWTKICVEYSEASLICTSFIRIIYLSGHIIGNHIIYIERDSLIQIFSYSNSNLRNRDVRISDGSL